MTKLEEIVVAGVTYSVHVQHRFEIHLSFIRHKRPKTQATKDKAEHVQITTVRGFG